MVLVLIILHQDNWLWADDRLIFGFLPIGLFYQICISVAAAAVWWWATIFCWPTELESADPQEQAP